MMTDFIISPITIKNLSDQYSVAIKKIERWQINL